MYCCVASQQQHHAPLHIVAEKGLQGQTSYNLQLWRSSAPLTDCLPSSKVAVQGCAVATIYASLAVSNMIQEYILLPSLSHCAKTRSCACALFAAGPNLYRLWQLLGVQSCSKCTLLCLNECTRQANAAANECLGKSCLSPKANKRNNPAGDKDPLWHLNITYRYVSKRFVKMS
jgi:hypothetical protein